MNKFSTKYLANVWIECIWTIFVKLRFHKINIFASLLSYFQCYVSLFIFNLYFAVNFAIHHHHQLIKKNWNHGHQNQNPRNWVENAQYKSQHFVQSCHSCVMCDIRCACLSISVIWCKKSCPAYLWRFWAHFVRHQYQKQKSVAVE